MAVATLVRRSASLPKEAHEAGTGDAHLHTGDDTHGPGRDDERPERAEHADRERDAGADTCLLYTSRCV